MWNGRVGSVPIWAGGLRISETGTRNKIVSPWGGEFQDFVVELIQEDRRKSKDLLGERGVAVVEDVPGGTVVFIAIRAQGIKPEQVGGGLGEEVGARGEGFDFVELILDEAMNGLHIGLPGVRRGRDGLVEQAGDGLHGLRKGAVVAGLHTADKLAAVIGLKAAAD